MGEFYLRKQLFSRVKQTKTQEALISPPACSSTQTTNDSPTQEDCAQSIPSQTTSPKSEQIHLSKSLKSMPQLSTMMIRQSSNESSGSSSPGCEAPSSLTNNALAATQTNEKQKKPARSKFINASRAISLLRRAASTITNSGSTLSSHLVSGRATVGTGSARVSSVEHQNTADSYQVSNNILRPSSSANFGANDLSCFIVPNMGALRLPLVCRIKSLDGELMREVFVHRYELGQYLVDSLKVSVGIKDCKYFGFKLAKSFDDQEDLRNPWLDLNESICKQLKNIKLTTSNSSSSACNDLTTTTAKINHNNGGQLQLPTTCSRQRSIDFYLRIKFYPPNLGRVQDSFLRHYLWLQLRRDLRLGKLTSSMNNLTLLMACVLQYEFGDCQPGLIERIPELNILPNQDLIEEQAISFWRNKLVGLKRHQAQMQFLRAAVILETYGFDYYPVRDHQRRRAYLLGFNYAGVKTIRNGRIVHHFRWHTISKISYERRMIIFHIYPNENSKRKQILGFKCLTNEDCQNLYLRLLEQKYFFTVDLAYFDKSVRKPSCLYNSFSDNQLHWRTGGELSADEAQSASTSFGPLQGPVSDQTRTEHLQGELDHLDEVGASSIDRSDTSSPVCQSQQQACSMCLQQHQQQQQQKQDNSNNLCQVASSNVIESGLPQYEACRCASNVSNQTAQANQLEQSQPGLVYLSSWLQETEPAETSGGPYWLSRQSSMQFPRSTDDLTADIPAQRDGSITTGSAGPSGAIFRPGLWTKMLASTRPQLVGRKLAELAEWVLVLPASFIQDQLRIGLYPATTTIEDSANSEGQQLGVCGYLRSIITPAFKLCLMILMINFLFRLADNCSNALIELLTMVKPDLHSSPTETAQIVDHSLGSESSKASFWR